MLQRMPANGASVTDHSVSTAGQTVNEDFFVNLIKAVHPKDAGLFLHLLTGYEERSCYRYASGERKPPAHFLVTLLRTEHGATFLRFIMEGCDADWWQQMRRAERIVEQIDSLNLD